MALMGLMWFRGGFRRDGIVAEWRWIYVGEWVLGMLSRCFANSEVGQI